MDKKIRVAAEVCDIARQQYWKANERWFGADQSGTASSPYLEKLETERRKAKDELFTHMEKLLTAVLWEIAKEDQDEQ